MTKLQLSQAYPVMRLTFVLVLMASALFFHESIMPPQFVVMALAGLGVGSQG